MKAVEQNIISSNKSVKTGKTREDERGELPKVLCNEIRQMQNMPNGSALAETYKVLLAITSRNLKCRKRMDCGRRERK